MAGLIIYGLLFPVEFKALFTQPGVYIHAKFLHILCVTLFFANTIIGTLWETRSLLSGRPEIIRYVYQTVVWLDAIFAAPLILISLLTGILLGTSLGGVWTMGWVALGFILFMATGAVWVLADIPTQYKIKREFEAMPVGAQSLPRELKRLLWVRMGINFLGIAPLLVVFFLMVHKPELRGVVEWVARLRGQ